MLNTDSQEISVKINKKFSNSIQTRGIIHDMDRSVNNFVKFTMILQETSYNEEEADKKPVPKERPAFHF